MKFQNKGAVPVQIAPLLISQPRNQNQSIRDEKRHGSTFDVCFSSAFVCAQVRVYECVFERERECWSERARERVFERESEGESVRARVHSSKRENRARESVCDRIHWMLLPHNPPNRETQIPLCNFKLNRNLNLNLYRWIPRNLSVSIWWISEG